MSGLAFVLGSLRAPHCEPRHIPLSLLVSIFGHSGSRLSSGHFEDTNVSVRLFYLKKFKAEIIILSCFVSIYFYSEHGPFKLKPLGSEEGLLAYLRYHRVFVSVLQLF